jgi:ATP-binding cassette subfamily B protein
MIDSNHLVQRPAKVDWRLAAGLLRYLYPYKSSVVAAVALIIFSAPLATVGPLLTKAAIDLFLAPDPSNPPSGYVLWLKQGADFTGLGASRHQGLIFIAVLFLLANIIQSATQYLQTVITENVGQKAVHDLRQKIFSHFQKLPIQFFDQTPVGRLMTRLTTDADALSELFSSGMITVFSHAVVAIYIAGWMFRINWFLALITCTVLLAMWIFTAWLRKMSRPVFRNFRERIAVINAFLQEHLTGMHVIQIFTREPQEMEQFERVNGEHWRSAMAATLRNALFFPAIEIMALIGIALVIWYGGGQVMSGAMSLGSLIAFVQLAQSFYEPVTEIGSMYHTLQGALTSSEKIFELLDEPIAILPVAKSARSGVARGHIEFRNVWFAYHDDDWVLKNVSFTVFPGEKIAFVGHTGAGKTTITSLLLRFYEIQRGQILLDGADIRQMDPAELRSNFSIVPQDIFLFCGDLTFNIRLGNHAISDARVKTAARQVHLDEFVSKLTKGYQSEVLERGAALSVGQKQLVGFARALAFDRPILILDEATSSVDARTETRIRDAGKRIMEGRTAIVIAHRLSTVQTVDKILVLHKGEIRECGDHRSLLSQRGLYRKLCFLQMMNSSGSAGGKLDRMKIG